MKTLTIDTEFQNLIPPLTNDEEIQLRANVIAEGCIDPIITWQGTIIDGHHRYSICTENNIEFKTVDMEFESRDQVKIWIVDHQLGRRNINDYQKATLVEMTAAPLREEAKRNQLATLKQNTTVLLEPAKREEPGQKTVGRFVTEEGKVLLADNKQTLRPINTRDILAMRAGVSTDTIQKVSFINKNADEGLKRRLEKDEVSINHAYQELKEKVATKDERAEREEKIRLQKAIQRRREAEALLAQNERAGFAIQIFKTIRTDINRVSHDDPQLLIELRQHKMFVDEMIKRLEEEKGDKR